MRHTHEREIDGIRWRVNEFSATEGLRLLTRLTALCGEPLAKAFAALPKDTALLDTTIDFRLLGEAISGLAGRLDEDQVVDLVRRMLDCTVTGDGENARQRFDLLFQGRYLTLFKLLGFVLEVNYKLPLPDLLGAASPISAPVAATAKGAA